MTIFQTPNKPLITALLMYVIAFFTKGIFHSVSLTIYTIAIIIWAYEEITTGVNVFRKGLGLVVLLFVAYSLFQQLH